MTVLAAEGIKFNRNGRIILDVDYVDLQEGEITALIGLNGAGKTTLMQIMALLQAPTNGQIYFKGEMVNKKNIRDFRKRMAYVFQQPLLLDMSVRKNIEIGLKLRGRFTKQEIFDRVELWLNKLSIEHLADGKVKFLSGGEAQRVSVARALASEPEILFLDEPFSGLDSPTRGQLLLDLAALLKELKISTLFVTHDYQEIPYLADKITVIQSGKLVQSGPLEEIFNNPKNESVEQLLRWLPTTTKRLPA
ncbi:hypothetical protein JCM14036_21720 [Desulfotomaculum defluvii]